MKRIDIKFLLLQVVILVTVSMIIGIIVSVVIGGEEPIVGGFRLMPLFLFFIAMAYGVFGNYKKEPLGGTQYVYFEFYYNNKRVRIPTFTASNVYSLQSQAVLEGISKADAFCDLLTNAQKVEE